jgi:hypothetical protein
MLRSSEKSRYRFFFWRTDFVGVAMIVSGLFFILINFKVIPVSDFVLPRVLGILFFTGGLIFVFFTGAGGWLSWFEVPAGVFLTGGVVMLILGTDMFISLTSAGLFSTGLGLTFLSVFLTRRNHWWALIPTCVFFGLAGWCIIGSNVPALGSHPIFPIFMLGISFLVIYLYSVQKVKMRWSLITGSVIVLVSFCYLLAILLARWIALWPIVLLLIGLLVPVGILFTERRPSKRA